MSTPKTSDNIADSMATLSPNTASRQDPNSIIDSIATLKDRWFVDDETFEKTGLDYALVDYKAVLAEDEWLQHAFMKLPEDLSYQCYLDLGGPDDKVNRQMTTIIGRCQHPCVHPVRKPDGILGRGWLTGA